MLLSSCIDRYWMTGRYRMLGWRIEGKHTLHGANKVLWAEFNRESSRPIVTLVTVMAAEKIAIFHVCSLAVVHHVQMFELRPWSIMASIQWNWEYQMSLRENLAEENFNFDRFNQQWHLAPRARLLGKYQGIESHCQVVCGWVVVHV